jgi:hypothetical protein
MTKLLGCTAVALIMALSIVAVLPVEDPTAARRGPSLWESPDAISTEVERSRQLDDALATNIRIREERFRIINEFAAGSITLNQAIEQFTPLNEEDSTTWEFLHTQHPKHTSEQIVGYQLLIAAFARPEPAPGENQKLMVRVAKQLQDRFGDRILVPTHLRDRLEKPAANP